jgi:hypothetical protein
MPTPVDRTLLAVALPPTPSPTPVDTSPELPGRISGLPCISGDVEFKGDLESDPVRTQYDDKATTGWPR